MPKSPRGPPADDRPPSPLKVTEDKKALLAPPKVLVVVGNHQNHYESSTGSDEQLCDLGI